ncbi:MAG: hypothetical protein ACLP7O_11345, partial [Terracidiphilus sp.]
MVTGKLDGAWRVVARSRPRRLLCSGWFLPEAHRNAAAIWRQKLAERAAILATRSQNEIDWFYKAWQEEHPRLLRGVNSMDKPNGRLVLVS